MAAPMQIVHDRMVDHYPTEEDIRRVCGMVYLDTRRIRFDHSAANTWWSVVVEAAHQHRLPQLVSLALEEYPLDDFLSAAHAQLMLSEGTV